MKSHLILGEAPKFMKTKKRIDIPNRYQPVASRSLICVRKLRCLVIMATAAAEEFSGRIGLPIPSCTGIEYPVRATPSLRRIA